MAWGIARWWGQWRWWEPEREDKDFSKTQDTFHPWTLGTQYKTESTQLFLKLTLPVTSLASHFTSLGLVSSFKKFSLDQRMLSFLPALTCSDTVTLRQILEILVREGHIHHECAHRAQNVRHYQRRGIFRQWELTRLRSICKVLLDGKDLRGYIAPLLRMPTWGLCVLRPTWAHPGSKADIPAEVGIRGIFYSARAPESVPLFPTSLKSLTWKALFKGPWTSSTSP